jgi:hypothetical protein
MSLPYLQKQIQELKNRNKRVERDKAWETSMTRKIAIMLLTYMVIVIFFFVAKLPDPFINAIVPSLAFLLSTLTMPLVKAWWMKKNIT